ncbi:MAG: amylo-alpha-1,6-glucosidase [Verrucomicrobia bacterium]|nr:amylo-alpha-1,6-glucosidase [Verrucomicrobiota bacterium]
MSPLSMTPPPGGRLLRFVGDTVRFALRPASSQQSPGRGWSARLRTDLGRADLVRREIVDANFKKIPLAGACWRDVPMRWADGAWSLELTLAEVGWFKAKAYALDPRGWQHWPDGPDAGVTVHPDWSRSANTIYCAFARMFGAGKTAATAWDDEREAEFKKLDAQGFTVIPPSGTLRDLARELPHIFGTLGCRILHLLPVNPTPTTMAKFGRFGSPYAALDLTGIDPALVEFDRRTTATGQFRELADGVHERGGRLFLDIVINHTGWGSRVQEAHPEWFLRDAKGSFVSPGAWGVTWEDLTELEHVHPGLWVELADVFLTWCRRGVDGFRCDAGYKVPMPAWQFITARVRQEFPDTVFLLEGLGGGWAETESLLTDGGMQWAYSELFQENTALQVQGYLDHALKQSSRVGVLVHYSETHDNARLAAKGRAWSLFRNRLSALTSVSGGYGFTCGVEWLATEKVRVHGSTGMNWGATDNITAELAALTALLAEHPCFLDGARLTRVSPAGSPVFGLVRQSADNKDVVLVLANTDADKPHPVTLDLRDAGFPGSAGLGARRLTDLLGQVAPRPQSTGDGHFTFTVAPLECHCLALDPMPLGLTGSAYRRARAQAAWGLAALARAMPAESIGTFDWRQVAAVVDRSAADWLASVSLGKPGASAAGYAPVVTWRASDRSRVLLVPPHHWLLVEATVSFRATLLRGDKPEHAASIATAAGHVASFGPSDFAGDAELRVQPFGGTSQATGGAIRYLASAPAIPQSAIRNPQSSLVLLTNGRGGMARLCVDPGNIHSKYDCVLGANLNASVPVDRHVFVKRLRLWCNADGFITPLNGGNLVAFEAGPRSRWQFVANAGDGRAAGIELSVEMLNQRNTVVVRLARTGVPGGLGRELPASADVRLTARFDIEDRNFHWETKRNSAAEHHFSSRCQVEHRTGAHEHTRVLLAGEVPSASAADAPIASGFSFTPARDRQLRITANAGVYHAAPEWSEGIPHPVEGSRGMAAGGDAWSPGWFELPLAPGRPITILVTAEAEEQVTDSPFERALGTVRSDPGVSTFERTLIDAASAFVVRRGDGKTVIAGYPWFLDWGRDTLIAARGLLAGRFTGEVRDILLTFARFEANGTLPNAIYGDNASNRDTVDAPLWFALACEEFAASEPAFLTAVVDSRGRALADVLRSIAENYLRGTPNGIRVDAESALVWSPGHFTWMDTNFPAGTPREGYAVEIQALWIRLLRLLDRLGSKPAEEPWTELAARAERSLTEHFWLDEEGWFADVLIGKAGVPAKSAVRDPALRSNMLFTVSLGFVTGERARRCVAAAARHLIVPGALRSLAPLPVSPPLEIRAGDGRLLNDPANPYWGRYEGDEDTRRKPAYHNGTAWCWTFPTFCEALACAYDGSPEAVAAARAYLGSVDRLLAEGCLGHLPEICDGDAPHAQRGCDAQAWSVTEALRVWRMLNAATPPAR